jgi:hypothetical protein
MKTILAPDDEKSIQATLTITRIIVAALCLGVLTFGFVVLIQKGVPPLIIQLRPWPLSPIACAVAAMSLVMSFVIPSILRQAANKGGVDSASGKKENLLPLLLQKTQNETIIGCAILEGAAFLNLAAAMLEPSLLHLLIAAIVWFFLVARFPLSAEQFVANVEERLESESLARNL